VAALATPLDWTGGPALLWVLGAALLYWAGGRRLPPRPGEWWRTVAFAAGLLALLIALDSPLDAYADELFWAHMVQGLRRDLARGVSGPGWRPARRLVALAGGAIVSWLLFNLDFWAWHLPVLYDAALRLEFVHAFEHLSFFATALLFWTRVIPAPPWRSPLSEPGKLAYLGSTLVAGWVLAIVLAVASAPLYSAYADQATRPGGISALTDQQFAAGVMWVPGSVAYMVAIVVIAYRWLEPERPAARSRPKPLSTGVG
jgi:putative membrane protein